MAKAYRGRGIFLAFLTGIALVLSLMDLWILNLGYLNYILGALSIIIFYIVVLIIVYRITKISIKREEKKISLEDLMPKINLSKSLEDEFSMLKGFNLKEEKEEKEAKEGWEMDHDHEYEFVASTKGNVYHNPKCRLARLINPKFRAYNNNSEFFEKRKYKPCGLCIK